MGKCTICSQRVIFWLQILKSVTHYVFGMVAEEACSIGYNTKWLLALLYCIGNHIMILLTMAYITYSTVPHRVRWTLKFKDHTSPNIVCEPFLIQLFWARRLTYWQLHVQKLKSEIQCVQLCVAPIMRYCKAVIFVPLVPEIVVRIFTIVSSVYFLWRILASPLFTQMGTCSKLC